MCTRLEAKMKYLFSVSAVLAFVLSSCMNVPESAQENTPTATVFAEDLQESATAETNTGEDVSINSIEIVGGNKESLREFIKQWLVPVYPDGSSQDMTVYIGSMPKDLPYDLPTPDDARIIGSITGSWVDYMLIFDTSLPSKSIHEFYAQNLTDTGWNEAPTNQGQSGFVSQSGLYSGYCHEDHEAFLRVETPSISNEKTSIRLNLDIDPDPYNCDAAAVSSGYSYENLIPQLTAPSGTLIQSGGAGSSDRDAEVTASLQSDLSPVELVEFYNQPLLASGWKMQDSGNGEGAAWSHWTFTDEQETNWLGSLIVLKASANSDRLFALLRIEKDK
jgi:hypothetical protein